MLSHGTEYSLQRVLIAVPVVLKRALAECCPCVRVMLATATSRFARV